MGATTEVRSDDYSFDGESIIQRNRHNSHNGKWYGPDKEPNPFGPRCGCGGCQARFHPFGRLIAFRINRTGDLYRPNDVDMLYEAVSGRWDVSIERPAPESEVSETPHVGANPETCRHRVIIVTDNFANTFAYECFSCGSLINREHWIGRQYKYDPEHDCWVQVGRSGRSR